MARFLAMFTFIGIGTGVMHMFTISNEAGALALGLLIGGGLCTSTLALVLSSMRRNADYFEMEENRRVTHVVTKNRSRALEDGFEQGECLSLTNLTGYSVSAEGSESSRPEVAYNPTGTFCAQAEYSGEYRRWRAESSAEATAWLAEARRKPRPVRTPLKETHYIVPSRDHPNGQGEMEWRRKGRAAPAPRRIRANQGDEGWAVLEPKRLRG